jgi:hypothetical protein
MDEKLGSVKKQIREFQVSMEDIEIHKATEGYGYNYADLSTIVKVITPMLKQHKLWYFHRTDFNRETGCNIVITEVYNVDDENDFVECRTIIDKDAVLPKQNHFMKEGSGITYFRRYHLTTLLGLLTDEDTDAGGKRVKQKSATKEVQGSVVQEVSNLVDVFKTMIEKKPKEKVLKTLELYKNQLTNDEIKEIHKAIDDKHS